MDSTQDSFTRRMLQRASTRKNRGGSLRSSSDDSRRKSSILQAIGNEPIKIADVADDRNLNAIPIKEKTFVEENGRILRRTSLTMSDGLISRRNDLPNLYWRNQYGPSHFIARTNFNADCKNPQDLRKPSNEENSRATFKFDFVESDKEKKSQKEISFPEVQRNRRNSEILKLSDLETCSATKVSKTFDKHSEEFNNKEPTSINQTNKINLMNSRVTSATKIDKPASMNFDRNPAGYGHDERKNNSNLTQTFNSTSLNLTENSTKNSLTSSSYVEGFELGNVKWRGPLYAACAKNKSQEKKDRSFLEKSIGIFKEFEYPPKSRVPEEPKLVKVVQKIMEPVKMRADFKTIENFREGTTANEVKTSVSNGSTSVNIKPDKISLHLNVETSAKNSYGKFSTGPQSPDSPTTPLSAEIKQLDAAIKGLEFHPNFYTPENAIELSPPERIQPNSSKIKFTPTGYSPRKLYKSPCSPDQNLPIRDSELCINKSASNQNHCKPENYVTSASGCSSNVDPSNYVNDETRSVVLISKNKNNSEVNKSDKFHPNLESTRRSSFTDISKNTGSSYPLESTVSTVTAPPGTPEILQGRAGASSSSPNEKKLDSTIPYDVENFLADALGDELYNTTVTYPPSEAHDRSISQFNASELISEERTPVQKKNRTFLIKAPMTEPPPQHMSTFNRTMTIYRSLTQRIKEKLRPGLRSLPKTGTNDCEMKVQPISEDKKIQALLQEANIQHTLMYQANKALTLCRSMKEFLASTEQMESERSLLVAGLRKTAALDEIKKMQDCEMNNNDQESCERGEVTVKNFSLALKQDILAYESQNGDFVQWFVITVTHRETVWATRPISCPVQSPRIIFPDTFIIPNLTPNFKITIRIYSLKMRRTTFNHDDKYHLNKTEKHSRCPSPKKLILRKTDRPLTAKQLRIDFAPLRNTSFVLSGTLELFLHDLSLTSPWPLTTMLPGSVLSGTIDLTLSCKLHLSVTHSGFLTHGDEAGGFAAWNRRWCVLRGQNLMFWNYPCDQEDKEPLATIDLTNCISSEISSVDRSLCAKPRTLLIETARRRSILDRNSMLLECRLSCTIVRNLLCCDTARDFSQWKSKLNHVTTALRDWNVTNRLPHVQVSDL